MEIVDTLFKSIFFGFIVWTIFWSLTTKEQIIGYKTEDIDNFLIRTSILLGVIHVGFVITNFIDWQDEIGVNESIRERAFGKYWFGFWVYPLTYFGLTQLFWIDRLRANKTIRLLIGFWIFCVMHFEKFVIFVTSFHRDYSPDGSNPFPFYILRQVGLSWLIAIIVFTAFVAIGMKLKNAVQHKR